MIKTYHFLIWGKSLTNILGKSRLTQAFYQTRYEQYFETLKFKKKKPSNPKPTHK